MSALELDDSGARYVDGLAAKRGVPLGTQPDAGFFTGALGAPAKGLMRGIIAKPAKLVGDAAAPVLRPVAQAVDSAFGATAVSDYVEGELRKNNRLLDDLRADPATTGIAGQVLHGLFDVGSSAILFTPEGAAAMEGYSRRQELLDKGVDPGTATVAGAVSGAALFAGVKAPVTMGAAAVGRGTRGVLENIAVGSTTNLAAGIGERGFTRDLLEHAGYKEMAAQYQPYDKQALWTEAILGTVLSGATSAIEARNAKRQAALDAALTVRNSLHASLATAPGVPADANSAVLHQSTLEAAVEQVLRGEPVNVPNAITEAAFVRSVLASPEGAVAAAIREAYRDNLPAAARYAPSERLTRIPVDQRRTLRFDAPELNEFAASVEQKYGLPGGLINALKNAGEKSGSAAVSPVGARGVMQFMPENLRKFGVSDATDPVQIIDAAGRYLSDTMRQYGGNVDAVIADYNGGPRQARRVLNGEAPAAAETRAYLARVREYLGPQEQPARARQLAAEQFADRVGRVAEMHPDTAIPTFRDGTAYTREHILPFYDEAIAGRDAGAPVPDVLFRIGQVDAQTAAGLRAVLPGFHEGLREARVSAAFIAHIHESRPAIARHVLSRLDEGALYADEVLPNPKNPERALLVLNDVQSGSPKQKHGITVLEVAPNGKSIDVVSSMTGPDSFLRKARALKREMEAKGEASPPEERQFLRLGLAEGQASQPHAAADFPTVNRDKPVIGELEQTQKNSPPRVAPEVGSPSADAVPEVSLPSGPLGDASSIAERGRAAEVAELRSARAIASDVVDMRITLDDGTEITAREALAQVDDAIAQSKTDARAFEAAVTCYLRNGS